MKSRTKLGHTHPSPVIKPFQRQPDGGLESDDAERAPFELLHLFSPRMRRMISGDGIDGASYDPL